MRYDHGSDLAYFMLFPMTPVVLLLVSLILENNFEIGNYSCRNDYHEYNN